MCVSDILKGDKTFISKVIILNCKTLLYFKMDDSLCQDENLISHALEYENAYYAFYGKEYCQTISNNLIANKNILLTILKKCKQYSDIPNYIQKEINKLCLDYYHINRYELMVLLKKSNLRSNNILPGMVITIQQIELNQITALYNITITSMAGNTYYIHDQNEFITFNDLSLAIMIYELYNVVFVIDNKTFDLVNFNESVIQ